MKLSLTLSFAVLLTVIVQGQDKRSDRQLKERYVQQQGYLSPNSGMSLHNPYGDSLKGFDEKELTSSLVSAGVDSWEIKLHLQNQKRKFINEKYGLTTSKVTENSSPKPVSTSAKKKGGTSMVNVAPCVN